MLFCPWQFVGGMLQKNSITILCGKSPTYNQLKFNVLSFLSNAFVIVSLVDQSWKCMSRDNIIIWSELNAQVWVSQVSWSRTLTTVQTATLQLFRRFFLMFGSQKIYVLSFSWSRTLAMKKVQTHALRLFRIFFFWILRCCFLVSHSTRGNKMRASNIRRIS